MDRMPRGYTLTPTRERIEEARLAHRHTVTDMAKHLNISRRTLQRWRTGESTPTGLPRRALLSYIYGGIRIRERENRDLPVIPPGRLASYTGATTIVSGERDTDAVPEGVVSPD